MVKRILETKLNNDIKKMCYGIISKGFLFAGNSFILTVSVISLILLFTVGKSSAGDFKAAHKIVIQVSSDNPRTMNLALNNATNIINALGQDNVKVEIVAYGPGIKLLLNKNKHFRQRVSSLILYGVKFAACGNTMRHFKLSKKDIDKGVPVVRAGVLEIMSKEEAGWSYIRP